MLESVSSPGLFQPSRWLSHPPIPFPHSTPSRSVRESIGKNLAYAEMRFILSRLLWDFGLQWDDSKSERYTWDSQGTFALWPLWDKKGLVFSIRKRRGRRKMGVVDS